MSLSPLDLFVDDATQDDVQQLLDAIDTQELNDMFNAYAQRSDEGEPPVLAQVKFY